MIYYMSTKTLVKEFTPMYTPEEILGCNFIKLSNKIIKTPSVKTIPFDNRAFYMLEDDVDYNLKVITDSIIDNPITLSILLQIIQDSLLYPNHVHIIVSSPNEIKTRYPEFFARAVSEMFQYPIIDFKKSKDMTFKYNEYDVYNNIYHYSNILLYNECGTNTSLIHKLSKKRKKDILKTMNLYEPGMDIDEINSTLLSAGLPFSM